MKFWLCRPNNIVTVDDAPRRVDLSDVPTNVYLVDWGGKDGTILYNDRAGIRETFDDPSAYQIYINRWMLSTQEPHEFPPGPPLTVDQAQAVKSALINSLFNLKRQAPIQVTTGSGSERTTTTYDASDENVSNMQSQALQDIAGTVDDGTGGVIDDVNNSIGGLTDSTNSSIGKLATSVNSALAQHNANINAMIDDFNNNKIAPFNSTNSAHNIALGTFDTNLDTFNTGASDHGNGVNSNTYYMNQTYVGNINYSLESSTVTTTSPGSGSYISTFNAVPMAAQTMPYPPTIPAVAKLNTSVGMLSGPSHVAAPPPVATDDVSTGDVSGAPSTASQNLAALNAIKNRRNTLKTTQNTKQGQLAALTSVAQVAAYDITAGW